jgi:hypothetical protein
MVSCPSGQHPNPDGARFCNACGAALAAACPACSHHNPPESRFCNACGYQLVVPPPPEPPPHFVSPQAYTPKHLAEKILTSRSALGGWSVKS